LNPDRRTGRNLLVSSVRVLLREPGNVSMPFFKVTISCWLLSLIIARKVSLDTRTAWTLTVTAQFHRGARFAGMSPSPSLASLGDATISTLAAVRVMVTQIVAPRKGLVTEDARVGFESGVS
jgi:hypothetical protein